MDALRFALAPLLCSVIACSESSGTAPDAGPADGGGCPAPAWDPMLTRLDGNDAQNNAFPHAGFDAAGNVIVIWEQTDLASSLTTLWSATRTAPGVWSAPVQIDGTGGMSAPPHSRLAVAPGGTAIAVWEEQVGRTYALPRAAVYDGSRWGTPALLHPDIMPSQVGAGLYPRVVMVTNGDAIVAFAFDDGAADSSHPDWGPQIYVARFAHGSWGAAGRLSSYDGTYQFSSTPDVSMTDTGDAVVVWEQEFVNNQPGDGDRVLATRVVAGMTSPSGMVFVDTTGSTNAKNPVVAVDQGGTATVAWIEPQATASVYASRLGAGSLQGSPTRIDDGAPGPNAAEVQIAVDSTGKVTAVWRETANDPRAIWANRSIGGMWTGAVAVETSAAEATNPGLALDDGGGALAVWETGAGIKAAFFAIGAGTWGSPVVLNPTASTSGNASVAFAHGCPTALAVWSQGTGQGGGAGAGIASALYK